MTTIKTRQEAKSKYQGHRNYTVETWNTYTRKTDIDYRTDDIEKAKAFAHRNGGYIVDHRIKKPCRVCGREVRVAADWKQGKAHYNCDQAAFHKDCNSDCTWKGVR